MLIKDWMLKPVSFFNNAFNKNTYSQLAVSSFQQMDVSTGINTLLTSLLSI